MVKLISIRNRFAHPWKAERPEEKIDLTVRGMGVEIVGVSPEGFAEAILKATRGVEWETSKQPEARSNAGPF
jgi:hypothetical protein